MYGPIFLERDEPTIPIRAGKRVVLHRLIDDDQADTEKIWGVVLFVEGTKVQLGNCIDLEKNRFLGPIEVNASDNKIIYIREALVDDLTPAKVPRKK